MATATKNPRTLVSNQSLAAGGTVRGTVDLRTALGGVLSMKIVNGATGPTIQCSCNVLMAHNSGSTPAAASAGTDWKTIFSFAGGVANNAVTEQTFDVPPGVMHLEVEFTGNTGQAVTVEAFLSELTSVG